MIIKLSSMIKKSFHNHNNHHLNNHGEMHHDHSGMAASATLHCLTCCAIGEILGQIIGNSLGMSSVATIALSVTLAFLFVYSLSALPLLKNGISFFNALKIVLVADTVSILTMVIVDNAVMFVIPGAMGSGISSPIFWISMAVALIIAYFVVLPMNKYLLKRNKGHAISHNALGSDYKMNNVPLVVVISAFLAGGFLLSLSNVIGIVVH